MKNIFVLDTNVVLHDPQALLDFEDNDVVLPLTVIEEIDRFKGDQNEIGCNARKVSQMIEGFRASGRLIHGVNLKGGGSFRIAIYRQEFLLALPPEMRNDHGANRILAVARNLQDDAPKDSVIFITKDTNLRIKADSIGLRAEDYETKRVSIDSDFVGPGSGGYIVLDLPNDKRSLFHDLLKGFEDYSRLKGYEVNFSIDTTFKDKIAFKFTVSESANNVESEQVKKDFKEYFEKVNKGENLDDIPMVTSFEEHSMLLTVLKNRINFLQHSYNLAKNTADYFETLFSKLPNITGAPSHTILVQTGGTIDSSNYSSSKVIRGDGNQIQDSSVSSSITIGDSFNSRKEQIDKIDEFIKELKKDPHQSANYEAVIRDVEKVKDELKDEPQPDPGRVTKWLERSKQTLQLGSLGQEVVSAAKELFSAFGIN